MTRDSAPAGPETAEEIEVTPQEVWDEMESSGGDFVRLLSRAWRQADTGNRFRLTAAFGDLYDEYERMAEARRRQRA